MRFPNLKTAWLRFRRAKKQVTAAKNNAKVAAAEYSVAKKVNSPVKSLIPPRSSGRRSGIMRMVRIKSGNSAYSVGLNNNGYNNLKSTHKYNYNKNYWVRKN